MCTIPGGFLLQQVYARQASSIERQMPSGSKTQLTFALWASITSADSIKLGLELPQNARNAIGGEPPGFSVHICSKLQQLCQSFGRCPHLACSVDRWPLQLGRSGIHRSPVLNKEFNRSCSLAEIQGCRGPTSCCMNVSPQLQESLDGLQIPRAELARQVQGRRSGHNAHHFISTCAGLQGSLCRNERANHLTIPGQCGTCYRAYTKLTSACVQASERKVRQELLQAPLPGRETHKVFKECQEKPKAVQVSSAPQLRQLMLQSCFALPGHMHTGLLPKRIAPSGPCSKSTWVSQTRQNHQK